MGLGLVVEDKPTEFFTYMYMYAHTYVYSVATVQVHMYMHYKPKLRNDSQFQLLVQLHHDLPQALAQLLTQQWEEPGPLGAGPRQTVE